MDQGTQLIRLALFGQPVASSLSPTIHRLFAEQLGLAIEYRAIEAGPGELAGALEAFRREGGSGCNVTLPLKGEAWRLAADSSKRVGQARAANTLVYQSPGWFAHNTDGAGLMADLEHHSIAVAGQRLVVLGAGGAAAGILSSLLEADPAQLAIVNRNKGRAHALADRCTDHLDIDVRDWAGLAGAGQFDLVINATSLGHQQQAPPLVATLFAPDAVCYDLNYGHAAAPLRDWCEAAGRRYVDGLGMLVEQAAESFAVWTGKRPDSRTVIEKLR